MQLPFIPKGLLIIFVFLFGLQLPLSITADNLSLRSSKTFTTEKKSSVLHTLYETLCLEEAGLSKQAFEMAVNRYETWREKGIRFREELLTIIDFSKPSSSQRLFVLNIPQEKIVFKTWVSHGKNSGLLYATRFSNQPQTYQSSLGFFKTLQPYQGENGYSLRLEGLDKNINDKAFERAIVMHGAPYVSAANLQRQGYLGRSWGCPAVPVEQAKSIIDLIKNGSLLFIYHPVLQQAGFTSKTTRRKAESKNR